MKKLYLLSALSVVNLAIVVVIANLSKPKPSTPVPTPIIVVDRVIRKVQKLATPKGNFQQNTNQVNNNSSSTQTAPPTQAPIVGCIITIDGAKYDITQFRYMHSGGDVFTCGADMSSLFWSRHGQRQLSQMQKYRI